MGDRLQVCMVVGSVPTDRSGDISIIYANGPMASLFGYASSKQLVGMDVRTLMPPDISKDHRSFVGSYVEKANGGTISRSSIMGSWRELVAVRKDGSPVHVAANVADIRNSEERYFVALFKDRTDAVQKEHDLRAALKKADELRAKAEKLKADAEVARKQAEDGMLKQKRLTGQINLLRQIFGGTMALVVMLGVLVVASWLVGTTDKDALSMIERVLLVLTGILGSAMSSVFDSRHVSKGED
jgi:PAS domain S-box-containing protein